jgi:hypothetical protein
VASQGISNHILPVSATMVGVCITVISLVQLIPKNAVSPFVDKLMALATLIFLASTWLSYWSIRNDKNTDRFEYIADWLFLGGLSLLGLVSVLVAFDLFLH